DAVIAFFAGSSSTFKRATDYESSLEGIDTTLDAYTRQPADTLGERDELLAEANRLPDRVAQLGEEARGEEHARLVRQRYLIGRATKVIDSYRRDIDAQQ